MGNPYFSFYLYGSFFVKIGVCLMSQFVATIVLNLEDSFCGRKPTVEMIKSYLLKRICSGSVNEASFRSKVVMDVKSVRCDVIDIN
jgi:hypothetical protein